MLRRSALTLGACRASFWLQAPNGISVLSSLCIAKAPMPALVLFPGMGPVPGVPSLTLIRTLLCRRALVTGPQRPMVQAAVISAGCALLVTGVVYLFVHPDTRGSGALRGSITAVHMAALLLSWFVLRSCVAPAVLL
jgi:hypothetical protein